MPVETGTFDWAFSHGAVGVMALCILGLLGALRVVWNAYQAEKTRADTIQEARIGDKDKTADKMTALQEKTFKAVDELAQGINFVRQGRAQ